MHKFLFSCFILALPCSGFSQQTWKELWHLELDSTAIWDIDPMHQSIVYQNQSIQKRDAKGQLMLQESIKSLGNIQKIDAQNPLKIALFSEDQQSICFLDNALARVQRQNFQGEQFSDAEIFYFYKEVPIDCSKKDRRPCDSYMQKARDMVNKLKQHRI